VGSANGSKLRSPKNQNQGTPQKGRKLMAMFEGPDRNRNIIIIVAVVVVVAVIYYLYTTGRLSGII